MASNVSVEITADVSDVRVKLALAQDAMKTTAAEVKNLSKAANAGGMTAALQADLGKATVAADKASARFAALRSEVKNLGQAQAPLSGLTKGLDGVKGAVEKIGSLSATVMGLGEAMAAAFAVDQIQKAVEHAVDYGAEIGKTAKIIGVTTDFLQEFNFAAKQSEVDVGAADNGLKGLNASLGAVQANLPRAKQLAVTFKALGFTADQLRGYRDAGELLPVLADRIQAVGSAAERAAIARKLGIEDLLPLLSQGSAGFNTLTQRARDLGVVMDASLVKQSEAAKEKLNEVDQVVQGKLNIGLAAFSGTLLKVKEGFAGAEIAALHFLATVTGTLSPLQKVQDDLKSYNHLIQVAHVGPGGIGRNREMFDEIGKKLKDDTAALREWNRVNKEAAAESSGAGPSGAAASAPQLVPDKATKSKKPKDDTVSEWTAQLDELKTAQENWYADENQLAVAFWSKIVAGAQGSAKDQQEAAQRLAQAREALDKKGVESAVDAAKRQAEAAGGNVEKVKAIYAGLEVQLERTHQAGSEAWKKIEDDKVAAVKKAAEEAARATKEADTEALAELKSNLDTEQSIRAGAARTQEGVLTSKASGNPLAEISAAVQVASIKAQLIQQQMAAEEAEHKQQDAILQDDIDAAAVGSGAYLKAVEAKKLADLEFANKHRELEDQATQQSIMAAQEIQQKWQSITSPIASSFSSMFQGMYMRQETFGQAALKMGDQLLFKFVDVAMQDLAKWTATQLAKTAATMTATQAQVAASSLGATQTAVIASASNVKEIGGAAAVGAANAYKALAGVPIVGPALGAAAAVATFGAIEAYGAMASFEVGVNSVPRDMPAFLHAGERVIPKADNSAIMAALSGRGPGATGRDSQQSARGHTFNFGDVHMHGTGRLGASEVEDMLEQHRHLIAAHVSESIARGIKYGR